MPAVLYDRHFPLVAPSLVYVQIRRQWQSDPFKWFPRADMLKRPEAMKGWSSQPAEPFTLAMLQNVGPGQFSFQTPLQDVKEQKPADSDAGKGLGGLSGPPAPDLARLPPRDELFLWINQPGLRGLLAGPYSSADLAQGTLDLELPECGGLDVSLSLSAADRGKLRLNGCGLIASRLLPEGQSQFSPLAIVDARASNPSERTGPSVVRLCAADLAPGRYEVAVIGEDQQWPPGQILFQRELRISPGKTMAASWDASEFYRGGCTVRLTLLNANGTPAAGKPCMVGFVYQSALRLDLAQGATAPDGRVEFRELPARPLDILVDGKLLNEIEVQDAKAPQEIELRIPPVIGDLAPDFTAVDLDDGKEVHLSDFKGKVVLILAYRPGVHVHMYAESLLMARHKADWGDRVVVIGVCSGDQKLAREDRERIRHDVAKALRGPPQSQLPAGVHMLWAGPAASPAYYWKRYGLIPQSSHEILIDATGHILSRGLEDRTPFDPEKTISKIVSKQ